MIEIRGDLSSIVRIADEFLSFVGLPLGLPGSNSLVVALALYSFPLPLALQVFSSFKTCIQSPFAILIQVPVMVLLLHSPLNSTRSSLARLPRSLYSFHFRMRINCDVSCATNGSFRVSESGVAAFQVVRNLVSLAAQIGSIQKVFL